LGGLSKKTFQINTLSDHGRKDMLLLDSGNLLFKRHKIAAGVNQERLTAEKIIDIYQGLGYSAVGVGPLDLAGGVDFLRQNSDNNFPWISANLFGADDKPLFTRWIRKKIQGVDVIITAITASSQQIEPAIKVKTWDTVLPDLIEGINKTSENPFIILLSSLTKDENHRIAEQYPDIHLLIGADRGKNHISRPPVNGTILIQTGPQGKYQGLFNLTFGNLREWEEDHAKQLADLQNKLGSLNWQLGRLEKKAAIPENGNKYDVSITRLRKEKEELNTQINATQNKLNKESTTGTGKDQFTHQFIGLKKKMPFDQAIERQLTQLKQEIRELNQKKKAAARKQSTEGGIDPHRDMLGNEVCGACHVAQADFWKSTGHAKAYTTLVQKEKNLDLECLPCHMTQDIQNTTLQQLPLERLLNFPEELQAVGCETCHGSGKKHSMEPERIKTIRLPGEKVCLTCHTPDHDDNFDYNTKLPKVSCPAE
jgi:Cytochrome c554 and c-prime